MLRDVFYYGKKPNAHPREQYAENLEDARLKATTRDFWIINEFCDYRNFDWDFDFEFLPDEDVWAEDHNNVWPSQHQKDSGTWLCPKEHSDIIIYRGDVDPVIRKNEKQSDNWVELDLIDHNKFDFSWHPDPTDPPYIYKWGCKFFPAEFKHVLEYRVPGATQEKFMRTIAELVPEYDRWVEHQRVDKDHFDMSWRPSPLDPPFIYVWGNKYIDGKISPTLEYHVPGATDKKHMPELVPVLPEMDNWEILEDIDRSSFDFKWRPDPTSPPYIYAWGNQWNAPEDKVSVQYVVPGATDYKYMDERAVRMPCMTNWLIPEDVDVTGFDFSWEPSPAAPPYIYEFATQWQKTGGPQYIVEGATEKQYVDFQKAKRLPSNENWTIPDNIDPSGFDFSWHPDATSPPYVYVFATQWAFSGGPVYTVPGATELKYVDDQVAVAKKDMTNWVYPDNIDISSFDFSWHPYVEDQPYIYQFGTQWQKTGGPRYITPGANSSSPTKYIDTRILKSTRLSEPDNKCWNVLYPVQDFDFSWHPDETEEPYIYVFGNTLYAPEDCATVEYRAPGATERKYVRDTVAKLAVVMDNWEIPDDIDVTDFDFSWIPNPNDPPYIYQFGTQWQKTGGPRYIVENATETKYIDVQKAIRLPDRSNWVIPDYIDANEFDFTWHPDDTDPDYTYQFGTQWALTGGPKYIVNNATEVKYIEYPVAKALPNMANWVYDETIIDVNNFDFSWHPYVEDQPYIYQFGTQWHEVGGPRYYSPGSDENSPVKYVDTRIIKAVLRPSRKNWEIPTGVDVSQFDFSWVPHPAAPSYIYQFGTLQDPSDGPIYVTPNNTGEIVKLPRIEIADKEPKILEVKQYYIDTTLEDLVNEHPSEIFWAKRKNINYDDFDFDWRPNIEQAEYVHVFGSADSELTQTYLVSATQWLKGNRDFNWVENVELTDSSLVEMFVKPDMFYVDRGNTESISRFEVLKAKFGSRIQKTRYLNSWVDTINRCINRSTTDLIWVLNSELDYSNFDFNYYPNPWQMRMVHVFGTQWSHWGTTFLVNRESFPDDTKYVKIIEHLSCLNFVKNKNSRANATNCTHDIVVIDHGNSELSNVTDIITSKASGKNVTIVPYNNSYLDTLKDIVNRQQEKKEHYIWICSSVCDYADFDFSYICDPYAKDQLHVFPSGIQKFGDTFFVDVNKARELISEIEKLDEYKLNFNATIKAKRLPEPVIVTSDDTHIAAAKNVTGFPYVTLITQDNADLVETAIEPMNLWAPDTKNILITSTGGTRIVVPAEVKDHMSTELYDYPYIKRMPKLAKSKEFDIVFVSNGETVAEQNYEHLLNVTKGLNNKIHRVDGINGRTEALHAAAEASESPWFFGVPAKLFVNKKFDWNYQADRLQLPKHYIFNAHNPVNDLFYGHQSMVLYNKNLVLGNKGVGLDFTLDSPHMSVELNSGIVVGDTDEYSTWRTAFREAVKLKKYSDNGDEVAKQRLDIWTTVGKGNYGEWSIKGALDGIEFYDEANGELTVLRQSYYWDWLRARFESKY